MEIHELRIVVAAILASSRNDTAKNMVSRFIDIRKELLERNAFESIDQSGPSTHT